MIRKIGRPLVFFTGLALLLVWEFSTPKDDFLPAIAFCLWVVLGTIGAFLRFNDVFRPRDKG